MIRFIGIGTQIGNIDEDSNEREFAFYDTVAEKFVTGPSGEQVWRTINQFKTEFEGKNHKPMKERCLNLIPKGFFPGEVMDECACGGNMISTGEPGESKCDRCSYILIGSYE